MPTAVISTTFDDKYVWYLPLTVWAWNKIGYDVVCFMPRTETIHPKLLLINSVQMELCLRCTHKFFDSEEHKSATYCQVSRLLACCLDLPKEEQLVVSDIDMLFFAKDYIQPAGWAIIDIYGADLVPPNQFPMCYLSGTVETWRLIFGGKTYQQWLDEIVGSIESDHFRGCQWSLDQDNAYRLIKNSETVNYTIHNRAREGTQFSSRRYDRDDAYILDRLSPDTIDFHMNRPGYEDANFEIILKILQYHYPQDDFTWLTQYNEAYKALL
ncbi:MAG: hypothetical protein V4547_17015 [Bacteroidota bacterium]